MKRIHNIGERIFGITVSKKVLACIFVIVFLLSVIPIYATSFYAHPVFDDFDFGIRTHEAVQNGESFLGAGFRTATSFYFNWQGFFLSSFWASVQPFNINVRLYCVSCMVAITMLIVSLFYLSKALLVNLLHMEISDYLLITIPFAELILQFLPSPAEGFYWMDGSLSVTFLSAHLIMLAAVLNYHTAKKHRPVFGVLAIICVLLISGDVPNCYMITLLCLLPALVYAIAKRYRVARLIAILLLINTATIVISLVAPGNSVRAESMQGLPIAKAFVLAIFYSYTQMGSWLTIPVIACAVFAAILFAPYAKKIDFPFKCPLLIAILCFGLLAAQQFVKLYASSGLGAPRQYNQYYITFISAVFFAVLYFTGWYVKRHSAEQTGKKSVSVLALAVFAAFVVCGCLQSGVKEMTSVSTGLSLINGETQRYSEEMTQRQMLLEDTSVSEALIEPLSNYPEFFREEPLSTDKDYWTNHSVALYYEKDAVILSD